jgi:hypothetical protein
MVLFLMISLLSQLPPVIENCGESFLPSFYSIEPSRGLTYKALTCFAFSRLAGKFSQRAFAVAVEFKIWYL